MAYQADLVRSLQAGRDHLSRPRALSRQAYERDPGGVGCRPPFLGFSPEGGLGSDSRCGGEGSREVNAMIVGGAASERPRSPPANRRLPQTWSAPSLRRYATLTIQPRKAP